MTLRRVGPTVAFAICGLVGLQSAQGQSLFAITAATTEVDRVGTPVPTIPAEASAPRSNILWTIPLRSLSATRERPIFRSSRRPIATAVVGAPAVAAPAPRLEAAPERPRLALVGTIAGDNDGIAVFVNETTRDVVRLRTGEGHEGWILREVRSREVVLEKAQETVIFALPSSTEEKGPASTEEPK